jgi:DNA-binding XRE family transcriptional regulator
LKVIRRELRAERSWTQSDLAAALGFPPDRQRSGSRSQRPLAALAFKIARLFERKIEEVFFYEE